jgi:hypothetical protein
MISAIKALFTAIGSLFGWLDRKQLLDAGEAKAENKMRKRTIEEIARLDGAITDDDRDRVWNKHTKD